MVRKKLPILFIVKATPDGSFERKELPKYPKRHVYAVQQNAWMDARVQSIYITELLSFEIDSPSVIVRDNLDCHVSPEAA